MSNIIPFEFESNKIRTVVDKDGTIWFVAKDIAEALGYKWHHMLLDKVPEEWKGGKRITSLGGKQEMSVISEQGLYFFCVRSDKPKALPLQKWIAGDVLPTLRKTGSYSVKAPKTKDNKPKVFITGMLLKELRLLANDNAERLFEAGIDNNQIIISTSRVMESVLGVDTLEGVNIPTPNNSQYYTATALGEQLEGKPSGKEINKRLVRLGLLLVEHEPSGKRRNILTPKGKELGGRVFDAGKKHSDGSIVQQIKWQDNILDLLRTTH